MNNDLISRQAAVEAAVEYLVEYCGGAFNEEMQNGLKERLEEVKPKTGWILMDECFPDLDTYVLVQLTDIYYDPIQIMSLHLRQCTEQDDTWVVYWKTQEESIEFDASDVVAWMPLPEPYKETDE